jgi:hypothetical protein
LSHLDDVYDEFVVLDRVDDSILALPQSVLVTPREFFTPRWTRLLGEVSDAADDPLSISLAIRAFDFFDCRRFEEYSIFFHAFSGL